MIKTNANNKQSAFIIPYYANAYDQLDRKKLVIADTVKGLFAQTDQE
ncbi:MAG TPA: hypothetical protein VH500_04605 [Nitrososphaeraceae archaeon]|jgi:hypothetical protein